MSGPPVDHHYHYQYTIFSYFPGNGFIEGQELDGFLREFVTSVNASDVEVGCSYISLKFLEEKIHIKESFLFKYLLYRYQPRTCLN